MNTTATLPSAFQGLDNPKFSPSKALAFAEVRMLWEIAAGVASWPFLRMAPKADGHTTFVYPGFLADDMSTAFLRRYLGAQNVNARPWGLGKNLGLQPGVEQRLLNQIDRAYDETGEVSLVGWSLGGLIAQYLAALRPTKVRTLITLGSPVRQVNHADSKLTALYEMLTGQSVEQPEVFALIASAPKMPATSIYSRTDGVVAWECSRRKELLNTENIEVHSSHLGLGFTPSVLYAVIDRLAQPKGLWAPFDETCPSRLLYPNPYR